MLLVFGGLGAYLWWVRRAFKRRHPQSETNEAGAHGDRQPSETGYNVGRRPGSPEQPAEEEP